MKKTLALIFSLIMVFALSIAASAADKPLTLDIADGAITITATGYKQGDVSDEAKETAYTGDYVITGTTAATQVYDNITIYGQAEGSDITFDDLSVTTAGPYCLNVYGAAEIEMTGDIYFENGTSPVLGTYADLTVTGNADITLGSFSLFNGSKTEINCNTFTIDMPGSYKPTQGSPCDVTINTVGDFKTIGGMGFMVKSISVNAGGNIDISDSSGHIVGGPATSGSFIAGGYISVSVDINTTSPITSGGNPTILFKAQGDITLNSSTSQLFNNGIVNIESVTGKVNLACTSNSPLSDASLNIKAKGDITLKSAYSHVVSAESDDTTAIFETEGNILVESGNHAITADKIDIKANNLTIKATYGAAIMSGGSESAAKIDLTGDLLFEGINNGTPLVCGIALDATAKSIKILSDYNLAISGVSADLTATDGDVILESIGSAPTVSTQLKATGKNVSVINNGTGLAISNSGVTEITATEGDVVIENNSVNPTISVGDFYIYNNGEIENIIEGLALIKAENGTVKITNNNESGYISSGDLTVKAENIEVTSKGTNDFAIFSKDSYDGTATYDVEFIASNNITVTVGGAKVSEDDTEVYDYGNTLTVTTSAGTQKHTHNFVLTGDKAASCTVDGYTGDMACECGKVSVKGEAIHAPGHNSNGTVAHKDANCTEDGVVGGTYCDVCDNGKAEAEEIILALGHGETEIVGAVQATFENDGYTGDTYCTVCDKKIADGAAIPKLEVPTTPDEPADDCDHLCHKSGFLGFIWKIVRFFQKLFNINQTCACGVAHW